MRVHCAHDELVNIDQLKAHPKNPNKHTKDQIERLAQILQYQGFRYPVKVSKRSGFITSGHGRLEAAKLNGWEQVPVNYQDYDDDAQEYADLVADNAISEWSTLDFASINNAIIDFGPDFDLDLLGLDGFKVDVSDTFLDEKNKGDGPRKYVLEIQFPNDMEMMDIHDDLTHRGYIVKVKK